MYTLTIERIMHKLLKIVNSHIFDLHVFICGSLVLACYIMFLQILNKSDNYDISISHRRLLDILMSCISGIIYLIITQISPRLYFTIVSTIYASMFPLAILGIKSHIKKSATDLILICIALIFAIVMFCLGSCENNHFKLCILIKSFICAMGVVELVEALIVIWRKEV